MRADRSSSFARRWITTTTFSSVPDAPVTSFTLKLPKGPHSALTANGNLCSQPLLMPTTITAQNGKVFKQSTKLSVSGCGVQIVGHKVIGHTVYVTVRTFGAGRVRGGGKNLATVALWLAAGGAAAYVFGCMACAAGQQ